MPRNPVDPSTIPEVAAYEEARDMLAAYREAHAQLFTSYDQLVDSLNQKLSAADKAVRGRGVSCSDWDLYQYQSKIDAEALYSAVGMDAFLQMGGKTTTKTIYGADKAKVEAAAARGELTEELVKEVIVVSPRYHAPKSIS